MCFVRVYCVWCVCVCKVVVNMRFLVARAQLTRKAQQACAQPTGARISLMCCPRRSSFTRKPIVASQKCAYEFVPNSNVRFDGLQSERIRICLGFMLCDGLVPPLSNQKSLAHVLLPPLLLPMLQLLLFVLRCSLLHTYIEYILCGIYLYTYLCYNSNTHVYNN